MARAKRTDRADARRRYRATQSDEPEFDGESGDEAEAPAASGSSGSGSAARRPAASQRTNTQRTAAPRSSDGPAQRPSFTGAFRAAARPFDIRSDIAYIPTLVLRTRAVWIPALAAIASGALFLGSQPLGSNGLANLAFQLFVLPPTIAGAFLAGILAPRATYIAGGLAALAGALVFSFAVAVTPINLSTATVPAASPSPSASAATSAAASPAASDASAAPSISPGPSASSAPTAGTTASDADKTSAILQSILLSVPFGIAIGAFGGYYKRFLYLSNPNRQRRAAEDAQKKAQRQQPGKRRY